MSQGPMHVGLSIMYNVFQGVPDVLDNGDPRGLHPRHVVPAEPSVRGAGKTFSQID